MIFLFQSVVECVFRIAGETNQCSQTWEFSSWSLAEKGKLQVQLTLFCNSVKQISVQISFPRRTNYSYVEDCFRRRRALLKLLLSKEFSKNHNLFVIYNDRLVKGFEILTTITLRYTVCRYDALQCGWKCPEIYPEFKGSTFLCSVGGFR